MLIARLELFNSKEEFGQFMDLLQATYSGMLEISATAGPATGSHARATLLCELAVKMLAHKMAGARAMAHPEIRATLDKDIAALWPSLAQFIDEELQEAKAALAGMLEMERGMVN